MVSPHRLPPLGFSPQPAAFNLRESNNRSHGALPRDGLLFGYLKGPERGMGRGG